MLHAVVLLAVGMFVVAVSTGCNCKCEVECVEGDSTYGYTTIEMKRSECEELNKHGNSDCNYHCSD
jgi:hypothetical protein